MRIKHEFIGDLDFSVFPDCKTHGFIYERNLPGLLLFIITQAAGTVREIAQCSRDRDFEAMNIQRAW